MYWIFPYLNAFFAIPVRYIIMCSFPIAFLCSRWMKYVGTGKILHSEKFHDV